MRHALCADVIRLVAEVDGHLQGVRRGVGVELTFGGVLGADVLTLVAGYDVESIVRNSR